MTIQAVVFDLDGTLLNTLADIADAVNTVLNDLDCPTYPVDAYAAMISDGLVRLLERALPTERQDAETIQRGVTAFDEVYLRQANAHTTLYDGISELLDLFVQAVSSPQTANQRPFAKGEQTVLAEPDPSKPALAHVFNVTSDPFVGKLCAFRIHQGTVTSNSQLAVTNPHAGEGSKPFKISHLFQLQGKEHKEVQQAIPGDIVAVAKVEQIHRDSVLQEAPDQHMSVGFLPGQKNHSGPGK